MSMKLTVDSKKFVEGMKRLALSEKEMRNIEYAGSRILVNRQRANVPVDKGTTKLSIDSHITESSAAKVIDEVGPETEYAVYLEYGTGEFAESGSGRKGGWFYKDSNGWHFTKGMPARPYIRPSVTNGANEVFNAISQAFAKVVQWKT